MRRTNVVAWAALIVAVAALVSSRAVTRTVPAAAGLPSEGQKEAKALSEAFEAVADFVRPSVVKINVIHENSIRMINPRGGRNPLQPNSPKDLEEMLKRFFGPEYEFPQQQFGGRAQGTGSGFVYDDKGHILTNNHVIDRATKVEVVFHDGSKATAKVIGADKDADVAVIQVEKSSLRPALRGKSGALKVGELVMAIGAPFGLGQTVTTGIISATERSDIAITAYGRLIQTDAAINPGNSGGPLVDMDGRVVGINTAIATGAASSSNAGVGFAIPIDFAENVADQIIKTGKVKYARLGVQLEPLTADLAKALKVDPETKGLVAVQVVPGSPAAKAGIKVGDVITSFNGTPTINPGSLRSQVALSAIGKEYDLVLIRHGKEQHVNVVLAPAEVVDSKFEGNDDSPKAAENGDEPQSLGDFGLSLQALTPELASRLGHPKTAKGLVVTEVKEKSPAEDAEIQVGDLVTSVIKNGDSVAVDSVESLQKIVGKSDEITLLVKSAKGAGGGLTRFVTLKKAK